MTSRSGTPRLKPLHSANVRICHWINVVACGYLLLSGIHIFLDFPELYWGHTGYQGYPAIFKLSDWGISWDAAGEMGNRMWGRNYHFTFAWVFLINGLVYVAWGLWKQHFRNSMGPRREDLAPRNLWRDLRDHLHKPRRKQAVPGRYGTLQRISYLSIVFIFVPVMLLTGLAQSPGFTAAWPWLLDLFGGRQSARTLHSIGTILFVIFVVVHVLEVFAAGARNQLRAMITGGTDPPEQKL